VDFVCLSHQLVVELDGAGHLEPDQADYDQGRTALLAELGFRFLSFSNEQALTHTASTLATIQAAIQDQ
jgi:very-short-patch-repair endonuclease